MAFKGTAKQRKTLRFLLWKDVNGKCVYCNRTMWVQEYHKKGKASLMATIEHIVPESKGGTDRLANLTCSCVNCNSSRGSIKHEHFLKLRKMREWCRITKKVRQNQSVLTRSMIIEHQWHLFRKDVRSLVKRNVNRITNAISAFNESWTNRIRGVVHNSFLTPTTF